MPIKPTTKFQTTFTTADNYPLNLDNLENQYEQLEKVKTEPVDLDVYRPYIITNLQEYNPIYSDFQNDKDENEDRNKNEDKEKAVLQNKYHILNLDTVVDMRTGVSYHQPVFVKFSPLLDPARYMVGKYDIHDPKIRQLPKPGQFDRSIPKLANRDNASYIDAFFCYLSSQVLHTHGIVHCIDYYGSFLGIQEKFKINVIDDMDYLNQSNFFHEQRGKLFLMDDINPDNDPFMNMGCSRNNKN
jgi:hypothetical protein